MTTAFQIGAFQFDAFQEDAIVGTISATDSLDTASITGGVLAEGSISATDQLDTATFVAEAVVGGVIYTEDGLDFAVISGEERVDGYIQALDALDTATIIAEISVSGSIDTEDALDIADIEGVVAPSPSPEMDMHDGFTKEEIKRARELDKKLEKARLKLLEAQKAQKLARKQKIADLVSPPVAKIQQQVVESKTAKPTEPLKKIIQATQEIKRLEAKQKELERLAQLRVQQAQIEAQLAILNAQMQAEQDDEESILALLL